MAQIYDFRDNGPNRYELLAQMILQMSQAAKARRQQEFENKMLEMQAQAQAQNAGTNRLQVYGPDRMRQVLQHPSYDPNAPLPDVDFEVPLEEQIRRREFERLMSGTRGGASQPMPEIPAQMAGGAPNVFGQFVGQNVPAPASAPSASTLSPEDRAVIMNLITGDYPNQAIYEDIAMKSGLVPQEYTDSLRVRGGIKMNAKDQAHYDFDTGVKWPVERRVKESEIGENQAQTTEAYAGAGSHRALARLRNEQTTNTIQERDIDSPLNRAKRAAGEGKRNFSEESKLRSDFLKESKNFPELSAQINRINEVGNDPSGQGDVALLFNFMKMLDPQSVVRESEYAAAAHVGSAYERAGALMERVKSGKKLTDSQRKEFVRVANNLYRAAQPRQRQIVNHYSAMALRYGLDPQNVVTFDENMRNTESDNSPKKERRVVGGVTYEKVDGGWKRVN